MAKSKKASWLYIALGAVVGLGAVMGASRLFSKDETSEETPKIINGADLNVGDDLTGYSVRFKLDKELEFVERVKDYLSSDENGSFSESIKFENKCILSFDFYEDVTFFTGEIMLVEDCGNTVYYHQIAYFDEEDGEVVASFPSEEVLLNPENTRFIVSDYSNNCGDAEFVKYLMSCIEFVAPSE